MNLTPFRVIFFLSYFAVSDDKVMEAHLPKWDHGWIEAALRFLDVKVTKQMIRCKIIIF